MTRRRSLLLGLVALAMAGPAFAADKTVTAPLKKLFPYLDAYLSLQPGERDRFRMAYRLLLDGRPSPLVHVSLVEGTTRAPLPIGPDGRIGRLPSLAALKSGQKAEITGPQGHKLNLVLDLEPTMAPAAEMDAHALALAAQQATASARKAAGVLGFAAPRLDRVVFQGAQGGQAVNGQGRAAALAVVKGDPVFDPASQPDVRTLRFSQPPRRLLLDKAQ